jgi:hypothetical protein
MTKLYRLVRLGDAKALTKGGSLQYFENIVQPADQPMA